MAQEEKFDPEWGTWVAKWTFRFTVLAAAAFVAAVFIFILMRPESGQ